ncbi:MAG: FIST N-terminal domain-containing protein [Planctomycetota bacterium]
MTLVAASGSSANRSLEVAIEECARGVRRGLDGADVHIAFVFVTHHHGAGLRRAGVLLSEALGGARVAGCTGGWTASDARELEGSPGVTVLALSCPGTTVRVEAFDGDADLVRLDDPTRAGVILFADPFTFTAEPWLVEFSEVYPNVPLVGGLAGGGQAPGQNILLHDQGSSPSGALAVILEGDVELRPAVSQGCRPVGAPLVITRVDRHVILELKGKPAAKVLVAAMNELPDDERERFQHGAFIGRAIDARLSKFTAEDLLVRNLLGIDPQRNAVVVGDTSLRAGQTVHLMVRDAESAGEDLEAVMARAAAELGSRARGALLATCGGRGRNLFEEADHDASRVSHAFGGTLPLAGFSANGEIGPVGGEPFLHGFTACVGIFAERQTTNETHG